VYRTQKPSYFKEKVDTVKDKMSALLEQDYFTDRDVAVANELLQQQIDIYKEMENSTLIFEKGVTAQVGDTLLKFDNADKMTDWLAGVLYG